MHRTDKGFHVNVGCKSNLMYCSYIITFSSATGSV